jgi:hypothetical protein
VYRGSARCFRKGRLSVRTALLFPSRSLVRGVTYFGHDHNGRKLRGCQAECIASGDAWAIFGMGLSAQRLSAYWKLRGVFISAAHAATGCTLRPRC